MTGNPVATRTSLIVLLLSVCGVAWADDSFVPGGALEILGDAGQPVGACPLKHTHVEADVVGFVGRVTVTQTFHNPLDRKIEAVYVFPLPQNAAVDDMTMTVGDRRVVGLIKPKDEAREIYEAAKEAGHVAGLLDQERPNIFTQSVANIEPGVEVIIEISYVETLKYEDGLFEWVFPMVVGPRYIPGHPTSKTPPATPEHRGKVSELDERPGREGQDETKGTGWAPDTDQVPDASRITPPVVKPGFRAGHDISLTVHIEAGMELYDLTSVLHQVKIESDTTHTATVSLKNETEIPNKDFILRYRLATEDIADAFLVHNDQRGSFFTMVLQPPRRVIPDQVVPRELIFVLDTSGSMRGFPVDKAKEVMSKAIDAMGPDDTFNLITFAGQTKILWSEPRPNTPENRREATQFLEWQRGSGGTEMMTAINAALRQTVDTGPIRIVCFMTDGYVGNDLEIIDAVKHNAGTTRVFSFGIGNSVNRFLLDGMAHAGRGEVEYVTLQSQGAAAVERFHERILAPVLTDIEIDWGGLPVSEVYPKHFPDLFSAKPVMIHGRLTGPAIGTITLRGQTGDGPFERLIQIGGEQADAQEEDHEALASLWARAKVKDLLMQDLTGAQRGNIREDLKNLIIATGVEFRLLTQFTSFVAVEEMTVTVGGKPTKIAVPVEMADGVSYEGVFGENSPRRRGLARASVSSMAGFSQSASKGGVVKKKRARLAGGRHFREDARTLELVESEQRLEPVSKLSGSLADLAGKVADLGTDGNLTWGELRVIDYRVDVMIRLSDTSPETLEALKKLGFTKTGESKIAGGILIGTIDVRKLLKLAELQAVIRVTPVAG